MNVSKDDMNVSVYKKSSEKSYHTQSGARYMNTDQKIHFTKLLELERSNWYEKNQGVLKQLQTAGAVSPDFSDQATQEETIRSQLRTYRRELKLLEKINSALQTIKQGKYGYCTGCQGEIGIARLEARPTATLCIDCKMLNERKQGY